MLHLLTKALLKQDEDSSGGECLELGRTFSSLPCTSDDAKKHCLSKACYHAGCMIMLH